MPSFSSETGSRSAARAGEIDEAKIDDLDALLLGHFQHVLRVMRSASFAVTWEQNAGPRSVRCPPARIPLRLSEPVKTAAFLARGTVGWARHRSENGRLPPPLMPYSP